MAMSAMARTRFLCVSLTAMYCAVRVEGYSAPSWRMKVASRPEVVRWVRIVEPALSVLVRALGRGEKGELHVVADHAAETDGGGRGDAVGGEGDVVADAADGLGDGGWVGGVQCWGDCWGAARGCAACKVTAQVESDGAGYENVDGVYVGF